MPGRDRSPRGSVRRGFTIVELLLVLVLMALLAATTVRYYFSHSAVTLENAAILLTRDIRAAQHRSLFLNENGLFTFLKDGSGYVVTDRNGEIAHNPQTDEPFLRRYGEDGVFHGVSVVEALAGGDRTLEIDKTGSPLEDLSVTLAFEGDRRTVMVTKRNGAITIVGSTSGWVDRDR
jgi:prepilin-type N-terminal cleavage/methylation domain-containing protein